MANLRRTLINNEEDSNRFDDNSLAPISMSNPEEEFLIKQVESHQNLLISLEQEISKSIEDIRDIDIHMVNAEQGLPKRKALKSTVTEQAAIIEMVAIELQRQNDKIDRALMEIEKRSASWQCIINKRKEAQIEEDATFDLLWNDKEQQSMNDEAQVEENMSV